MIELIKKISNGYTPAQSELVRLLEEHDADVDSYLFNSARPVALEQFGHKIYTRGLIEISNYCKNDCYYCGIRRSRNEVRRYRLDQETILQCCAEGYRLGFRTFVLQGGEDPYFTVQRLENLLQAIKHNYADCALTLSLGEMPREDYQRLFEAGADRYLLRHESATDEHYARLHPELQTLAARKTCLQDLKAIGFQVGCGFMVGSPYQNNEHLATDLLFIKAFEPEMIGVGPFIPAHDTPFEHYPPGTLDATLLIIGLLRLMNPKALIPATTALGTIAENGRELGILAGANVVMPNLSPLAVRNDYSLYDNKISTGAEAAECRDSLNERMAKIGYALVEDRGDYAR